MDEIRQALAVLAVLGTLAGLLWWLRRQGHAQFGGKWRARSGNRNMQLIERLALTPQHSLHLVRVGDQTIMVAASPGGCALISGVTASTGEEPTLR